MGLHVMRRILIRLFYTIICSFLFHKISPWGELSSHLIALLCYFGNSNSLFQLKLEGVGGGGFPHGYPPRHLLLLTYEQLHVVECEQGCL